MSSRMYIYPVIVPLLLAGGAAAVASPALSRLHGDVSAFVDLSATEVAEEPASNSTPCKTLDDIAAALGPSTTLPPISVALPKILLATPAPAEVALALGTPCHPVFDCSLKNSATSDWSGEKIQWCCLHKHAGCFFNVQLTQRRAKQAWEATIKLKNLAQEEQVAKQQLTNTDKMSIEIEKTRASLTEKLAQLDRSLKEREKLYGEARNGSAASSKGSLLKTSITSEVSLSSIATDESKVSVRVRTIEKQEEVIRKRKSEVDQNYTAVEAEMQHVEEQQKSMSLRRVGLAVNKASLEASMDTEKDTVHDALDEVRVEEGNVKDAEAALKLREQQYDKMTKDLKMRAVSLSAKTDKLSKMDSEISLSQDSSSKSLVTPAELKAKMNAHVTKLEQISKDLMNADTELSSLTMKQVLLEKKVEKGTAGDGDKMQAFLKYEIAKGSTLVTLEKTPIWTSPYGFNTSGFSERGTMVIATGTPVIVPNSHLHVAVPIQNGYIRAHSLLLKSLLLDSKGETTALAKIRHERGIAKGAPIVNVVAVPIYESPGSANVVGHKDAMAKSVSAGDIVSTTSSGDAPVASYMVPIEPKGFLELDHVVLDYRALAAMREDSDGAKLLQKS